MKKKILITLSVIACVIALVVGTIAGTVAYLRVQASVTNTFTYGEVIISMDETRVDKQGTPVPNGGRNNGNEYMLMPGTTYTKDPVIHIDAKSQAMYLFLKVDNGIAGLAMTDADKEKINEKREAATPEGTTYTPVITVHEQLLANGWKVYVDDDDNVYQNFTTKNSNAVAIESSSTVYYLSVGAGESETDAKIVAPKLVSTDENGKEIKEGVDIKTIDYFTIGLDKVTAGTMTAYVNADATIVFTAYAVQGVGDAINSLHAAANVFKDDFANAIYVPTTTPPAQQPTDPQE